MGGLRNRRHSFGLLDKRYKAPIFSIGTRPLLSPRVLDRPLPWGQLRPHGLGVGGEQPQI